MIQLLTSRLSDIRAAGRTAYAARRDRLRTLAVLVEAQVLLGIDEQDVC